MLPRPPAAPRAERRVWAALALGCALSAGFALFGRAADDLRQAGASPWTAVFGDGDATAVIGGGVDLYGDLWTFDHVARMLEGRAGAFSDALFAPTGLDLAAAQGMGWLDAALSWPLVRIVGIPDFYNLHLFFTVAASQLALVILFRTLKAPAPIAFGLSMLVVHNPALLREVFDGRPTQAHLIFPALFLAGVARLCQPAPRPLRHGLAAGAALAASCFVYWFGAVAVGLLGALALSGALLLDRADRAARLGGGLALSLSAIGLALAPTWRLAGAWLTGSGAVGGRTGSLDLGFTQIAVAAADRAQFSSLGELFSGLASLGLGALLLLLAAAAVAASWPLGRAARAAVLPWAGAALLLLTMPLGSTFSLGGHRIATAFGLAHLIFPPMLRCNFPDRTVIAPLLGLLAAAAAGAGLLHARLSGDARRIFVGGLTGLSTLAALSVAAPDVRLASVPFDGAALYRDMAALPSGGVVDVPLSESATTYHFQLLHGRPLLGGPGLTGPNTLPEAQRALLSQLRFLTVLETWCAPGRGAPPVPELPDALALSSLGFRLVVVHRWRCSADLAPMADALGPPLLSDKARLVFALPVGAPEG